MDNSPNVEAELREIALKTRRLAATDIAGDIEIGALMLRARHLIAHGDFRTWAIENVSFGFRTVQNKMAAATLAEIYPAELVTKLKSANCAYTLGVNARKKNPEIRRVVDDIMMEVQDGIVPDLSEIERRLDEVKPKSSSEEEASRVDTRQVAEILRQRLHENQLTLIKRFLAEARQPDYDALAALLDQAPTSREPNLVLAPLM